jgi:hypothetical protein
MPTDVIIDPTNGQIYWNNGGGGNQESISIKGDALNAISFVGYSGQYSPGSAPGGAVTLASFNDSSTSTLVPGTTNYELGSGTLRWKFYGSTGDFSSNTISSNLVSGAVLINGGIAISGNASIGQSLNFYNTSNVNYIGFKAGATSANTLYTLPTAFPSTGTSVLQSTDLGIMSWVGVIGTATTARNINVVSATTSASHPLLFTPVSGSASGVAVSSNNTLVYNPNTDILSVSGLAVTSGVDSTNTTSGAFQVRGGIGVTGTGYFDVVRTRAIVTTGDGTIAGNFVVNGTLDFGNAVTDTISFIGRVDTNINPIADNTYDLGAASLVWKDVSLGGSLNIYNGANYSGLRFSGTANTTYTLPPNSPQSSTGTSVLTSTIAGVMSWVGMSAGGGPSGTINSSTVNNIAYYSASTTLSGDSIANGNYFFYNGTNTGLNIAHVDNEFNPTASTKLLTVGTGATNYSTNRKALAVISTNNTWTDGDLLVLGVGNLAANIRFGVDWRGYVRVGTPGTGFTLPITNGTSGQVLTANTNGVASWSTVSGGGSGVVNAGTAFSTAYYDADGSTVSGTGLLKIIPSGTAISSFADIDMKSGKDIRFWELTNNQYTSLAAGNVSQSYDLLLPTAKVGAGSSVIITNSDGQMFFAAPGSGIAFSSATANTPVIRAKRPLVLQFSAGYTPLAAGTDNLVIRVPDSPTDGTSLLTYIPREFYIRVETPSTGSSRIQLERSTGTGAFTLAATGSSYLGGLGLTISGAGIYVTSTTTFAGAFITSGDNLRLNWTLLNATHANFSVQLLLEEV